MASEWKDARRLAAQIVSWRLGIWPGQAEKLIEARLGTATVGDEMSLDEKWDRLADVVIELHDEIEAAPAPAREPLESARTRAYAAYRAAMLAKRAA